MFRREVFVPRTALDIYLGGRPHPRILYRPIIPCDLNGWVYCIDTTATSCIDALLARYLGP